MQFKLSTLILVSFCCLAKSVSADIDGSLTIKKLQECQKTSAALERLSCYDAVLVPEFTEKNNQAVIKTGGIAWQRAMAQENKRNSSSTELLVSTTDGNSQMIIITTPALGYSAPRPVLAFSCVDNITRLQVALPKAINSGNADVRLETDDNAFTSSWFIREDGFLLEASRGLVGIQEIQKLFGSKLLRIKISTEELNQLTFNIENLETKIEPLKKACHW